MNKERLHDILTKVQDKYVGQPLSPLMVKSLYKDISVALLELHETEHFLNFSVDIEERNILVKDEETLHYLGMLPYLDTRLQADCKDPYIIYLLKGDEAFTQCAVVFRDLYNRSLIESELGFTVDVYPIIPLGVYHPKSNKFIEWRKE